MGALCSVAECDRKAVARTMCPTHWTRWKKGTRLDAPIKSKVRGGRPCSIDGCGRHGAHASGYCVTHEQRRVLGKPLDAPIREIFATDDLGERLRHYAPEGARDECWEWTRARTKNYGMIAIGNTKLRGAHIVAWEIANNRKLPPGMVVRHTCDNPPCTNPRHLLLGTHGENVQDRVEHGVPNKGVDNPMAKLTADDVRTIRRLYKSGMKQRAIAEQFGISQANVSLIVNRHVWGHI